MSPTAIQIRDKRPLGLSIYPAVELVTQRERRREKGVESGGGELTPQPRNFLKPTFFYHRSITIAPTEI